MLARSLFPCVFHNDYHDATRCHDCLHTASLPTKSWRSSSGMGEPGGQYFLASMTIIKHADMALGKNWECVSLNSNEYSQEERSPNMKGRKRSPSCNTANFKLGFKFCTLSSLSKNSTRLGPGHQGGKRNADPPRPQLADPAGHKPVPADDAARASPCRMTGTLRGSTTRNGKTNASDFGHVTLFECVKNQAHTAA